MKVKLLTSLGHIDRTYNVGDEYECSADEAARHVAAGNAEYIRSAPVERAVKAPKLEKAVK